jgi:glutamyl-tRNA reductase
MDTERPSPPRHVVLTGVNHSCSSVELRDKLLFTPQQIQRGLEELKKISLLSETVILSTCNRVEIYAVVSDDIAAREALLGFLARFHGLGRAEFEPHLYFYGGEEAVRHLFDVAASLDSLVVGEYQVLGQVKEAHRVAREAGNTGAVLNQLFQTAVTAGKRARAETKIGEGAVSVSSAAVKLARQILGRLEDNTALILGAGEMSELTVKHLKQAGIGRLFFANRTLEKSMALAREYSGKAIEFSEMKSVLWECDVVISATASPHFVLGVKDITETMEKRNNNPMFLIDIAAPRDIHPDTGNLYNVFLYNIDDLTKVTRDSSQSREAEIGKVRAILKEEMDKYSVWVESLKIRPLLVSLRNRFETLRDNELDRNASEIKALPKEAREFVRSFAESLTNKMLQDPSKTLIELSNAHDGDMLADVITRVFKLKEDEKPK